MRCERAEGGDGMADCRQKIAAPCNGKSSSLLDVLGYKESVVLVDSEGPTSRWPFRVAKIAKIDRFPITQHV